MRKIAIRFWALSPIHWVPPCTTPRPIYIALVRLCAEDNAFRCSSDADMGPLLQFDCGPSHGVAMFFWAKRFCLTS